MLGSDWSSPNHTLERQKAIPSSHGRGRGGLHRLFLAKRAISLRIMRISCAPDWPVPVQTEGMSSLLKLLFVSTIGLFSSRGDLLLENTALRQQLAVLRERRPQPRCAASDRLFWVILRRLWHGWKQTLFNVAYRLSCIHDVASSYM